MSHPDRVGREFKRRLGDPTPVVLGGTRTRSPRCSRRCCATSWGRVTKTEGSAPETRRVHPPRQLGPVSPRAVRRGAPARRPDAGAHGHRAGGRSRATTPQARQLPDGDTVAVYDLGGGTFDVTLLRKRAVGIDILGDPQGIERLGGVDFDDAILSFINYRSGGALSELDMSDPQTAIALARLRQDCILAKEALSVDTEIDDPGVPAPPPFRRAADARRVRGHDPAAGRVDDRGPDPHAALRAGRAGRAAAPCCWSAARRGSRSSPG